MKDPVQKRLESMLNEFLETKEPVPSQISLIPILKLAIDKKKSFKTKRVPHSGNLNLPLSILVKEMDYLLRHYPGCCGRYYEGKDGFYYYIIPGK